MNNEIMIVSEEDSERVPILRPDGPEDSRPQTAVYYRRWYIILVFSLSSFLQAAVWNTWGPITESAEAVLGWDDSDIGNLANYGNIAFVVTVIPICYFMDVKGMRISMFIASFLIAIGCGVRCFTLDPKYVTWISAICAILNGAGGVVPFAGPALISSLWFPLHQRATATALASFSNYFGMALSFLIGPFFVRSPQYWASNVTIPDSNSTSIVVSQIEWFSTGNKSNTSYLANSEEIKSDIFKMLYFYTILSGIVFVLVLVYFPDKPPIPPSISASKKRTEYLKGLGHLARNGSVWLIMLASSLPTGVLGVWSSILDVILSPLPISQSDAGYIGFWQTLGGCIASLIIARFSDMFMKRMKLFLVVIFILAIGSTVWFILICQQYIAFNIVSLYISAIGIGAFINGSCPLFYELSCEASYPVAEGVSGGFLTLGNNLFGIFFLLIMLIPNIGNSWENWTLLGSVAVALPMLCAFPERYTRTDLDITVEVKVTVNDTETTESTIESTIESPIVSTN